MSLADVLTDSVTMATTIVSGTLLAAWGSWLKFRQGANDIKVDSARANAADEMLTRALDRADKAEAETDRVRKLMDGMYTELAKRLAENAALTERVDAMSKTMVELKLEIGALRRKLEASGVTGFL